MTTDGGERVARPRPATDFAAAVGFLTLLPIGRSWPDGPVPRSVGWYPWVGWLLGGLVAVPLWLATRLMGPVDGSMPLVAALVVAAWALLTRFLHWDGLADSFDGVWGGRDPERRLEIMRDSRIGSFGAVAMLMVGLVQVSAVQAVLADHALWPLVMAPVIARASVSLAAWELPSARRDGLGLTAMGAPGWYDRAAAGSAVLALLVVPLIGVPTRAFVVAAFAGLGAGMVVPRWLSRSVGGMTGDLFGATVLIVETVVLAVSGLIL